MFYVEYKNRGGVMGITTKQYQKLSDINMVWDFFVDIYDENGGGVEAPFFEYAINSSWMNTSYTHLNRFWLDGDKVVAFVFYENPVTNIFFKIRPGYEYLAEEMIEYAEKYMPNFNNEQQFMLFNGQEYIMELVEKRGYKCVHDYEDRCFWFENELNRELPEGYHFVKPEDVDPVKMAKVCWYGFDNHIENGPFENYDREDDTLDWCPAKSYRGVVAEIMAPAPHSTHQYDVIIADENEEYVCFSGMWWVEKNHLAYMEPLCTVPEHRKKGLAAAALSKHYHTMKELGARVMTGGGDPFYEKIGYGKGSHWYFYKKG